MPPSKARNTADRAVRAPFQNFQYTFIGGKGGVGKTTCAAALGYLCARAGFETLVISTDPAPSLGDAVGKPLGSTPRRVEGVPRLHAVEVDAKAAVNEYLESRRSIFEEIALRGTWLDEEDVSRLLTLSLPGIDEVAGLLQIAIFARTGGYERIVVDTAPTGHLLRMLETPAILEALAGMFDHMQAKHRAMVEALRGGWAPDTADALLEEMARDARELTSLFRDRQRSQLLWVTLPELMSTEETVDALHWLGDHGIRVEALLVNRVTPPPPEPCRWCAARRRVERQALQTLRRRVGERVDHILLVPAVVREPRSIRGIAEIAAALNQRRTSDASRTSSVTTRVRAELPAMKGLERHVDVLGAHTRLVMFGGKGGVGKTTCAAATALDTASARPDFDVLLLSTDPAHSLADVLGQQFSDHPARLRGGPANLMVRELDAARVFGAVRDRFADAIGTLFARVSGDAGGRMAQHDKQVMRELMSLAPPGVDELVAILEVTDALLLRSRAARSRPAGAGAGPFTDSGVGFDLVVIDTAPTGHALRLIEMPGVAHDWVKALMAILLKYQPVTGIGETGALLLRLSQGLGRLRETLRDSSRARFVTVTRPAALPRAETVRLLRRLASMSVSAPVIVINAAGAGSCSRCRSDRNAQRREVAALAREVAGTARRGPRLVLAGAELPPPHGERALTDWRARWREVPNRA